MNKSKKFYLPVAKSTIVEELVLLAKSQDPFRRYYNFGVKKVDEHLIREDNFLRSLNRVHPFSAGILLIPSNSIYNWHTDDKRGVSVNMMLSVKDSHCIFMDEDFEMVNTIQELRYEFGTYYLFNSQKFHSVINFENSRLMFSVEFDEDKNRLSYDQLVDEYENGAFA
jgi:hypothetical protein